MRGLIKLMLISLLIGLGYACGSDDSSLPTAESINPDKFSGEWYEIASLEPQSEKECVCQVYNYLRMQDEGYRLLNRCKRENGEWQTEKGKAWPVNRDYAKLKVEYQWPFKGSLYILDIAPDYSYALVGNPDGKTLRILSRKKSLDQAVIDQLLARGEDLGYATENMTFSDQSCKN